MEMSGDLGGVAAETYSPDTGCQVASSCLDCPFERCLEEEPAGRFRYVRAQRNAAIAQMVREGKGTRQIAGEMGLSQRTVQRAVRGLGEGG